MAAPSGSSVPRFALVPSMMVATSFGSNWGSANTQVAFNLKKGSLPVRGDVDLAAANDCMKKGLDILAKGNVIQGTDQLLSADSQKQKEDLFSEFFANASMTPEDAQKRFVDIIASAD